MGSARGPRAGSGGSPESSSLTLGSKSRVRKCVGRGFRRAAENHTPAACAPRVATPHTIPTSEFGLNTPHGVRMAFRPAQDIHLS